jgi:hypothetical protein
MVHLSWKCNGKLANRGGYMGLSMRIEGLDTEDNIIELYGESLVSTEYQHSTIVN